MKMEVQKWQKKFLLIVLLIKTTWVAKYFDKTNKGKWEAIFDYYPSDLGETYFCI